jgi:predicted O-linked N-acetylglucosamine transferase (SPINDLY family)
VQVSHLGFFGTLGIPEIDFLFADDCVVRKDEEKFYTEQIYKFPVSYNHCDLHGIPEPKLEPPCVKNGYVTFGSFNTFHKISREVVDTWIELMIKVPTARLLFDSRSMKAATDINYYKSLFIARGVDEARLMFRANENREDFLRSYEEIDISLDPFPYTGGTTSLESLLLGVPLVTIMGNKWSSRLSSTTLLAIKRDELIAKDKEEYLSKLTELAQDQTRIINYRKTLRQDMLDSDLQIDKYVANFEKALKDIWQIKCSQH